MKSAYVYSPMHDRAGAAAPQSSGGSEVGPSTQRGRLPTGSAVALAEAPLPRVRLQSAGRGERSANVVAGAFGFQLPPQGNTVRLPRLPVPARAAPSSSSCLSGDLQQTAARTDVPISMDEGTAASLRQIKRLPQFLELCERLEAKTKVIQSDVSYRKPVNGDRYDWILPNLRYIWPKEQQWCFTSELNGSYVCVDDRPVAIVAQHPLPGENLFAFLKQICHESISFLIVLGSDAELANPYERMPDYFREPRHEDGPLAQRATNPPESFRPVRVGSHYSLRPTAGADGVVEIWAMTPMTPSPVPAWKNLWGGRICVSEGVANPFGPGTWRDHEVSILHLRNAPKYGIPTLDELDVLGQWVRGERTGGKLPLVHCHSGTGRSALVVVAAVLGDPSSQASAETVILDIRRTRNWWCLHAEDQIAAVAALAVRYGKPLLAPSP